MKNIRNALLKWFDFVEDFIELFYTQIMNRMRIRLKQKNDSWTIMRQKITNNKIKKNRAKKEFENFRQFWTKAQIREVAFSFMIYEFLQRLRQLIKQHKNNRFHVLDLLKRVVVTRVKNRNENIRLNSTLMTNDINKARKKNFDDMSQVFDNDLESLKLKRKFNEHDLIQNFAIFNNLTRISFRSSLTSIFSSTFATIIQFLTKIIDEKDFRITLSNTANFTHENDDIFTSFVSSSKFSSKANKKKTI